MKMKTAWMRQFLICLFVAYTYGAIPTLMRCSPAGIKGEACNMTCTTQDFLQTIEIKRNGSSRGSCTSAFGCTANMYQVGPTETYLQIPILSYTNDIGDWTCTYGSFTSTPPLSFTVYTEPTVTAFINGSSTAPSLGTKFDNVTLSARSYCYFPLVNTAELQYSTSGSVQTLATIPVDPIPASLSSVACDTHEFELQTNVTVDINVEKYKALSGAKDVYFQIIFTSNLGNQFSTGFQLGPYDFEVSAPTPDECKKRHLYSFLPVICITLVGTLLVIAVSYRVGKDSKLQEGSLKEKCGCCPSDNKFCRIVCPLCTKPLCTGSDGGCCSDLATSLKNAISVLVSTSLAVIIGGIIDAGNVDCTLTLILSIVCGLALVAIFTVCVYPHWPCLPEKRENGGNCFRTCRISTVEEPNRPAENQASPNRHTSRGRSPRPLPAIGSEAKQLPPISFEQSTLKNKQMGAPLPEIPKSNKLPPVDTVNNEEDKPKKRRKKKKKREEEENEEEDKRDSQNSGGQANVEEED